MVAMHWKSPGITVVICFPHYSLNSTQQFSTQLGTFEGVPAPGGHSPWPGEQRAGWISALTCSLHWAPSCSEQLAERWGCWGRWYNLEYHPKTLPFGFIHLDPEWCGKISNFLCSLATSLLSQWIKTRSAKNPPQTIWTWKQSVSFRTNFFKSKVESILYLSWAKNVLHFIQHAKQSTW